MTSEVFTDDQRARLLACWKLDQDRARAYIATIEPRVSAWLEYESEAAASMSCAQIRDACKGFADRLAELQRFADKHQEQLFALVHGQDKYSETEVRTAMQSLRAAAPVLRQAAAVVATQIPVQRGPTADKERVLVAWLAILYRRNFGKEPSVSPGSVFDGFLRELGRIIGFHFGPGARDGINDRGLFVPPAAGWHIGRDENL